MRMTRVVLASGLALAAVAMATPGHADGRIAGTYVVASSHGQPFCTDKAQLLGYLRASIRQEHFPLNTFNTCVLVPDRTPVEVIADVGPGTRSLHVVRARASFFFGGIDAYTFSAGLYRADLYSHGVYGDSTLLQIF